MRNVRPTFLLEVPNPRASRDSGLAPLPQATGSRFFEKGPLSECPKGAGLVWHTSSDGET